MTDIHAVFKAKKALIAGGLGFVGSNLAHKLADLGAEVLIVDSLISGYGGNLFNVDGIKDQVKINFCNICDSHNLAQLLSGQDYIFNLMGTHNKYDGVDNPFYDLELNCRAHLSVLETASKVNPDAKIVFCSNRNQYGKPIQLPVSEEHPQKPIEINGIHQLTIENYYNFYHRVHGLKTTGLRLTSTYGPRHFMRHHKLGVVNWFIKLILDNREVYIFGDGKQIRDINHVDDVTEAMLLVAAHKEAAGKVYNLGGAPVSMENLIKKLIELTGNGGYKIMPYPEQFKILELGDYKADYSKINKELGWSPQISLDEGLRNTIRFYERFKRYYW